MTERGFTPGAAGSGAARQTDSPDWDSPSDCPSEPSPLTAPPHVPTALLTPPSLPIPTDPPNRVAAADPVARRLAPLLADTPAAFDVPATGATHAATLAAHCPDLFLISTTPDRRTAVVTDLTTLAAKAGQRVLVLANDPEAVFVSLAAGGLDVGRAVGPNETADTCPCAGHTALARGRRYREAVRVGLADRVAELQARINTEERREKLLAEADARTADLSRVGEFAAATVDASDALKDATAARDAAVAAVSAHAARRAEVECELAALKQAVAQPSGFLKKLFGGGAKPEPAKIEAAEAKLRELTANTPPDPHAAFAATRDKLLAEATTARRAELEARLAEMNGELAKLPPAEPLDELCRVFDDATTDLARLDAGPPTLPAAELGAVRVVVGTPSAVGHDPFVTPTHPEVEPRFDRIVWADAEELTEDTFAAVAPLGAAWVLVGTPDPPHAPGYRNGRPRSPFFSGWWHRLHTAAWTHEDDRPLARLLTAEKRTELLCEPLYGRPDVEVRWTDRDGTPTLAEVLFPAGMPLPDAKSLLAHEADEVRFTGYGPTEWDTSGDVIRCRWPAVEAATGVREAVDLGHGVREETVSGMTASVHFSVNTWTRESAARWLSERVLSAPRTAMV